MRKILVGAHRGAMCHASENTLTAFEKAIEFGTYRIELDVRRSRDKQIVVMHDATVDRTTDGRGRVADMTLEELRHLKVGGTEEIPLLSEVLASVKGRCKLLVEIKEDGIADDVVELIVTAGMEDECTISSFNEETLRRVKELNPRIATACFLIEPKRFDPREVVARLGVRMLVVASHTATVENITAAKRCGLHIRCGIADNMSYEETYVIFRRMADMGVDEIACGRPDWIGRMAAQYVGAR